ncbi:hypothetical protein BJ742DRAFT_784017 [Cladochytrium replicatum]|nr:hypothetical protein BJ742DRAFT_784017 [Cladochytrium replicatum]
MSDGDSLAIGDIVLRWHELAAAVFVLLCVCVVSFQFCVHLSSSPASIPGSRFHRLYTGTFICYILSQVVLLPFRYYQIRTSLSRDGIVRPEDVLVETRVLGAFNGILLSLGGFGYALSILDRFQPFSRGLEINHIVIPLMIVVNAVLSIASAACGMLFDAERRSLLVSILNTLFWIELGILQVTINVTMVYATMRKKVVFLSSSDQRPNRPMASSASISAESHITGSSRAPHFKLKLKRDGRTLLSFLAVLAFFDGLALFFFVGTAISSELIYSMASFSQGTLGTAFLRLLYHVYMLKLQNFKGLSLVVEFIFLSLFRDVLQRDLDGPGRPPGSRSDIRQRQWNSGWNFSMDKSFLSRVDRPFREKATPEAAIELSTDLMMRRNQNLMEEEFSGVTDGGRSVAR